MAGIKEVRTHIRRIQDTQKITNALYLIASVKMRRAKEELDRTRPFFEAMRTEVKRIFRFLEEDGTDSPYFYPADAELDRAGGCAVLAITSDKGLAGGYNLSVLRQTQDLLHQYGPARLFVVGEWGERHFRLHGHTVERSFHATAKEPTMDRAREIAGLLLDTYLSGDVNRIFVVYTDFRNGLDTQVAVTRLLPFHRRHFGEDEIPPAEPFEFFPSPERVLDTIVPGYLAGFLYSALVDSFCCEQTARMNAMDNATRNAQNLLEDQQAVYNHLRQDRITREIVEVSSGRRRRPSPPKGDGSV